MSKPVDRTPPAGYESWEEYLDDVAAEAEGERGPGAGEVERGVAAELRHRSGQRDALLATCRDMMEWMDMIQSDRGDGGRMPPGLMDQYRSVTSAIVRATGSAPPAPQ